MYGLIKYAAIAATIGVLLPACKQRSGLAQLQNNGSEVADPTKSAVVPLLVEDTRLCTGTIINDKAQILTAAHCFDGFLSQSGIHVLVAIDGKTYMPKHIAIHPHYNSDDLDSPYDLAVLSFAKPIPIPAKLAIADRYQYDNPADEVVTVIGYGQLVPDHSHFGNKVSIGDVGVLRSGTNRISSALGNTLYINGPAMTADNDRVTPAAGDSGGPLLQHGKVIGVASRSDFVEADRIVAIYTHWTPFVKDGSTHPNWAFIQAVTSRDFADLRTGKLNDYDGYRGLLENTSK